MFQFCLFSIYRFRKQNHISQFSNYRRQFSIQNFSSSSCQHEIQTLAYLQYIQELLYHITNPNICSFPAKFINIFCTQSSQLPCASFVYFQPPRKLHPLNNRNPSENVLHNHFLDIRILYSPAYNFFCKTSILSYHNYCCLSKVTNFNILHFSFVHAPACANCNVFLNITLFKKI